MPRRTRLGTPGPSPSSATADYATLAGRSDAIVEARTGRGWAAWVAALDQVGAHTLAHAEIVRHVQAISEVSGWWAQGVAVGYERIKGLRAIGQRRGGAYEANKSRTFAVPLARLYAAFHDPRTRARWLRDTKIVIRSATLDKSMRWTWPDGTSVVLGFLSRGPAKSQVALTHEKLADQAAATRAKSYWTGRLNALQEVLEGD